MISSRPLIPSENLALARHNEEFARGLLAIRIPSLDWATTVCFYSALHYVYYKLAPSTLYNSHTRLETAIETAYPLPSQVLTLYNKLRTRSESTRYEAFVANNVKNDKSQIRYVLTILDNLKVELGIV